MKTIVIDTNVFVSALRTDASASTAARNLLRAVFRGKINPIFGNALWHEYRELLTRSDVWTDKTTESERQKMLAALAAVSRWVTVYYGWRPNLSDEGDNHLIELAIAGNADAIVTYNKKDLLHGQLQWPHLRILNPAECLEELK